MLEKVRSWIESNKLLVKGDTVVAACSGGPDSLALVHILKALCLEYDIELVVAHVDHMIRGQESADDAIFVHDFCRKYELRCYQTAINVPEFAATGGRSLEEVARELRYAYLRQIAANMGGAKIATGHHRDDQAETVLLNLLRGAGSSGLRGMKAENGGIIRPLLAISRGEIEEYCRQNGFTPRIDSTNLQEEYLRNRVRRKLLPLLEQEYNPGIKDALYRTATVIGDENDYIGTVARRLWPKIVSEQDGMFFIHSDKLLEQHCALQREILRLTLEKKQGNLKGISFYHVERLIMLAKNAAVGSITELPGGLMVKKDYNGLKVGWQPVEAKITVPVLKIVVPGTTYIEQAQLKITAELLDSRPNVKGSPAVAVFDWQALAPPLYVRTRLPGDRFQPLGLSGSKKLKDFFIDAKIPQEERNSIVLVCDSEGIIYVSGHRQSERGRVTRGTRQFLQLSIQQSK